MKTMQIICTMILLITSRVFAGQENSIGQQIDKILRERYKKDIIVVHYVLDDLIGKLGPKYIHSYEITDPYGTLKGFTYFRATPKGDDKSIDERMLEKTIIGFFKDGNIVWDSGELIPDGIGGAIFGSSDLNNDGEVDLMIEFNTWSFDDIPSNLWIISWDGKRGKILNAIETETRETEAGKTETGKSVIRGASDVWEIFDYEGDGIMEIRADWDKDWAYFPDTLMDVRPCVTYSWNGSQYGMWSTTPQIPCKTFLAKNRMTVTVQCNMTKSQSNEFIYNYTFTNHNISKQKISDIWLEGVNSNKGNLSQPYRWAIFAAGRIHGLVWTTLSSNRLDMIGPGELKSGYRVNSVRLPIIAKYYIQGDAPINTTEYGEPEITLEERRQDVHTNSVKGYTIGPLDTGVVYTPLILLDTLLSYTTQSSQLGWLKDKNTEKRIDQKIELAKRLLQMAENCVANPKKTDLLDEAKKTIKEDETVLKKEYGRESSEGVHSDVPAAEEVLRETSQIVMDEKNLKELEQYEKEIAKSPKDRKLNEAQCINLCEKIYTWLGIKMLESLIHEVEILNRLSERSKREYITSEAYALLKYNTEYLIEQLKKK